MGAQQAKEGRDREKEKASTSKAKSKVKENRVVAPSGSIFAEHAGKSFVY